MPTRTRIIIVFVAIVVSLSVFVPLSKIVLNASNRPQVVITIPPDALHSPLPYSTPLQVAGKGVSQSSAPKAPTAPEPFVQPTVTKLKTPGQGSVDINTATLADLQRLPGVGPAMAARILTERLAIGHFHKPSDLFEVRGIGPKKYAKMAPFVTVQ